MRKAVRSHNWRRWALTHYVNYVVSCLLCHFISTVSCKNKLQLYNRELATGECEHWMLVALIISNTSLGPTMNVRCRQKTFPGKAFHVVPCVYVWRWQITWPGLILGLWRPVSLQHVVRISCKLSFWAWSLSAYSNIAKTISERLVSFFLFSASHFKWRLSPVQCGLK